MPIYWQCCENTGSSTCDGLIPSHLLLFTQTLRTVKNDFAQHLCMLTAPNVSERLTVWVIWILKLKYVMFPVWNLHQIWFIHLVLHLDVVSCGCWCAKKWQWFTRQVMWIYYCLKSFNWQILASLSRTGVSRQTWSIFLSNRYGEYVQPREMCSFKCYGTLNHADTYKNDNKHYI